MTGVRRRTNADAILVGPSQISGDSPVDSLNDGADSILSAASGAVCRVAATQSVP